MTLCRIRASVLSVVVLLITAYLRPAACVQNLDASLLPSSLGAAECCLLPRAISAQFLHEGSATFREAARVCSSRRTPYTIFAGFRSSGTVDRPVFGCGSSLTPVCNRRPLDICSGTCLYRQTCYVRARTGQSFLERETVHSSGSTSDSSSINSTQSSSSTNSSRLDDGAMDVRRIDEVISERTDLTIDEKMSSDARSLTVRSGQPLLDFGAHLLNNSAGRRTGTLTSDMNSLSTGAPSSAAPVCCRVAPALVPTVQPGISSLQECQQRCQQLKFSLAVRITESSWGCASHRMRLDCEGDDDCDACLGEPACLTLYTFRVVQVESVQASRRQRDQFNVGISDQERSREVCSATLSAGVDHVRVRDVNSTTNTTDRGSASGQQLISIDTKVTIASSGNNQRASLSQASIAVGSGSRDNQRSVNQEVHVTDRQATSRNVSTPQQQGISDDSSTTDTTVRVIKSIRSNDVSRNASLAQARQGDADFAATFKGMFDLVGDSQGNASLDATEVRAARMGDSFSLESSLTRRDGRDDIRDSDGGRRLELRAGITVISRAVQGRSDNASTSTSTAFGTHDPTLGSLRLNRSRTEEGSDVRIDTVKDQKIQEERTNVVQCPNCGPTIHTKETAEGIVQSRTSTNSSLGALTTRTDQDTTPQNLERIGIDTRDRAEQQVTHTTGEEHEDGRRTTRTHTHTDGYEKNQLDDKSLQRVSSSDMHENRTSATSTLVIHRDSWP